MGEKAHVDAGGHWGQGDAPAQHPLLRGTALSPLRGVRAGSVSPNASATACTQLQLGRVTCAIPLAGEPGSEWACDQSWNHRRNLPRLKHT